jgi:hypothetical protein
VLRQASRLPRVPPVAVTDIRCPMAHSMTVDAIAIKLGIDRSGGHVIDVVRTPRIEILRA